MSQLPHLKRRRTDLAVTQLGHAFELFKQHQPSLPLVLMYLQTLLLFFVQKHWMFDGFWQAIQISVNEDEEN